MEQALILVTLSYKYRKGLPDILRKIPSLTDAKFIYGTYDLYAMINAENKEKLRDIVLKIRETTGVNATLTCSVMEV